MARPREFDADEALDKAMRLFWAKGYHDSSIRDLVERTGVNYYGLYEVFENKHGLFLAALDRYCSTVTGEIVRKLKRPGRAEKSIERAFDRLLALMRTPDGRVGCLMCNTAIELAPHDADAAAKVQAHMRLLRSAFRATLLAGRKAGELAEDGDIDALAEFLTTTVYSVGFLVRSGCSDAYVRRHVRTALSAVV